MSINHGNGITAVVLDRTILHVTLIAHIDAICSCVECHPFRISNHPGMSNNAVAISIYHIQFLACGTNDVDAPRGFIDAYWVEWHLAYQDCGYSIATVCINDGDLVFSAIRNIQSSEMAIHT